ncbi:MAG: aminotransferase class III-fold pyridoxal phosphate-dependent enzyme [Thermoleophilia bacterium]
MRPAARPAVRRQGDHRRLPGALGDGRPGRVFEAFLGEDLGPKTLYHGHSYGGNALAAAVAVRHLRLLEERDVLANVRARSAELADLLRRRIAGHPLVHEVRGHGLMHGVQLVAAPGQRLGRRVCAASVRRGVLLRPIGDVVIVVPPLSITSAELDRIVSTLGESLDQVQAGEE